MIYKNKQTNTHKISMVQSVICNAGVGLPAQLNTHIIFK